MKCPNCGFDYKGNGRVCPQCSILFTPFSKLHPAPKPVVRYSLTGKMVTALSVLLAVAALFFLLFKLSGASGSSADYESEMQELARLVDEGSSADYKPLIEARKIMSRISPARLSDSDTLYVSLEQTLQAKTEDAFNAWVRAAEGQYDIADNVYGALKYYARADSIMPGNPLIGEKLRAMSLRSGLKGAMLLITAITVNSTSMTIHYKYFGTYDTSMRLTLERDDNAESTRISLPMSASFAGEQSHTVDSPFLSSCKSEVSIYEGDQLLYQIIPEPK